MIYLDNAATTQIGSTVLSEMAPFLTREYGNPGSLHPAGVAAKNAVEKARQSVANLIGADPDNIIFTSGGSEANNLVIKSTLHRMLIEQSVIPSTPVIMTSASEHDSILNIFKRGMFREDLFAIIGTDKRGTVIDEDVDGILKDNPWISLASVMYVNNETGAVNNVKSISEKCKEYGVKFHTDCVQALGFHDVDVNEIGCDFLSGSSHKIHGPKGVGFLYVRNKYDIEPIITGGENQEFGLRGGTENVAGIVGFGKACEIAATNLSSIRKYILNIRERFYNKLASDRFVRSIMHINGDMAVSGRIINVRFDGVDAETLLLALGSKGICVSAGSACRSLESEPSHVLLAMGLSPDEARDSIRVSFSDFNTKEEVDEAASVLIESVKALKGVVV